MRYSARILFASAVCLAAGNVMISPVSAASAPKPGSSFKDCSDCPEMVVVPPGSFTMGATKAAEEREGVAPFLLKSNPAGAQEILGWSVPEHRVTVPRAFAAGKYHVTREEYGRFVADTKRPDPASCGVLNQEAHSVQTQGANWHNTGYAQTPRDPVVCTTWEDATAYAAWLSKKTGKSYRLLSEAEFEYAARAGTTTARYWGDDTAGQCAYANGGDQTLQGAFPSFPVANCKDGYVYTAPDDALKPNAFGLYGMLGNAFQWVQDCFRPYDASPTDSAPKEFADCPLRAERGGAWFAAPNVLRAAKRGRNTIDARNNDNGFRIARDL